MTNASTISVQPRRLEAYSSLRHNRNDIRDIESGLHLFLHADLASDTIDLILRKTISRRKLAVRHQILESQRTDGIYGSEIHSPLGWMGRRNGGKR